MPSFKIKNIRRQIPRRGKLRARAIYGIDELNCTCEAPACCNCCNDQSPNACTCANAPDTIAAFISNKCCKELGELCESPDDFQFDCHNLIPYQAAGIAGGCPGVPRTWQLIECGYGIVHMSGTVSEDGTLTGLPTEFCSLYCYDGFMRLQICCAGNCPSCPTTRIL